MKQTASFGNETVNLKPSKRRSAMKRITVLTILTALLALWTIAAWATDVPQLINFQGILRDGSGNPVTDGAHVVTFKIWDAAVGGSLIWDGGLIGISTTNGLFNVFIGAPETAFHGYGERWLGITVDPEVTELSPRTRLGSLPYAYEFEDAGPDSTVSAVAGASFTGKNSLSGAGDVIGLRGFADNSGSGDAYGGYFTTASSGTGNHYGLRSEANATSGTASSYALFSDNNATTASIHYGIVGHATGVGPVQNRGVTGFASGATGLNIGIRGDASGTGAYAGSFENARVRVGATGTENIVDGNGDLYLQDELEVDGVATFAAGTAAAPALTFAGDLNSGIYQPAADALGFATLGVERVRVNSVGDVGVGTTTPSSRLHVREDVNGVAAVTIANHDVGTSSQQRIDFVSEDGAAGTSFISVFDNSSASAPATMRFANNLAGGDIDFITGGAIRVMIDQSGNVGIGDATPNFQLDVEQSATTVAAFNRTTSDGVLLTFQRDGSTVGNISVAGGVVTYGAFTGSHYGWTDEAIERGELVSLTGLNRNSYDNPKSEVIYGIKRSTVANDPACLGSYLALQESSQPAGTENPHLIMAVGNGDMWVVDEGQDIQPGDYLISSSTPGHAMKDDPEKYPLGYVIARAAEPVNWASVSETVGGQKHKRISVLFESFVRSSNAALTKIVDAQQKEIEELKALVKKLVSETAEGTKPMGQLR